VENKPELLTDEQLIYKIVNADQLAFAELMSRYLSSLVKFSARYTHSIPCSEDIAQDAFLRVWKRAASWNEAKGSGKSWLFKIVYNATIDYLRKQQIQYTHRENLKHEVLMASGPETNFLYREQESQIHRALFELPERQRTALTLFMANGLNGKEVAAVMGLTLDASDSLLARARRSLKKKVEDKPEMGKVVNS
jgi:RNA polymerase sigma-70 factor (ECF subfamily)